MTFPEADTSFFFLINHSLQNPFFDAVMPFVTTRAFAVFLPFLLLLWLREKNRIGAALIVGILSVALADSAGHLLKEFIMRQRPCSVLGNAHLLVGCGKSYSLPSNHASNSFAFAMAVWFMLRQRISLMLLAPAALIGFSRIYVGVHYPGDVIAGAVLGTAAAYLSAEIFRRAEKAYTQGSYVPVLIPVLMLICFFRISLIMTGPFDLSPDEAHYWEWSRRPDWSYYSKGPMIAWLIRSGTFLLGDTVLGVRICAVILSALSSFLLFRIGKDLYDEKTGFASALLLQAVPLFSVFGLVFTIDSPFIFFWLLSLYLFLQIIRKEGDASHTSWVLLGFAAGLGLLTKYTMAFFGASAVLYLLFQAAARKHLRTPGPYIAAAVCIAVFSPVLIWNASHGWVTLKHTAGQAHLQEGLIISVGSFIEFLGSQVGVVTPLLFVMMLWAIWRQRTTASGSIIAWFSLPVLVFFLIKSLQGKVQANWAMTGYLAGIVAFSAVYIGRWATLGRRQRMLTAGAMLIALAATLFAYFPSVLRLPDRIDLFTRFTGWKELGRESSRMHKDLSAKGPAFIFSDSYQVASELAFYMESHPITYCANLGRRMNQYDLWPGFEGLTGQNALFVRTKEKSLPAEIGDAFRSCDRAVLDITTRQKKTMKFTIFTCYDFKGFKSRQIESF